MKGQISLLTVQNNIFVNFDLVNKKWNKLLVYGLAYKAITITLNTCKILNTELTIRLTNDKEMQSLNKRWRNKNSTTNVLAFPNNQDLLTDKKQKYMGDIILSYNVLKKESLYRKIPFQDHMVHLIVHGVLHLCGYEHDKKMDETKMINKEKKILCKVGIKDPY